MKPLSKTESMNRFLREVETERLTIARVVSFVREIDERRLYLDYDCQSLFSFLTKYGKYSKSAAQRRIVAARLCRDFPALAEDLETGRINLTQTEQLTRLIQEKEKSGKIDTPMKQRLIEAVRDKSTDETEIIICRMLDVKPKQIEIARSQADQSVRREATFTKDEELILHRVRDLLSHTNPNPSFSELVMHLAKSYVNAHERAEEKSAGRENSAIGTRARVFREQKCCQWKGSDGSICGSTFRLEIDHIRPLYMGGGSEFENLQLLCDQHNRLKYRRGA